MIQSPGHRDSTSAALLRAQHKEVMRNALLEVAAELVAEDGESALTMKAVAARFGSSVGMLYRLVDSKDDLLAAVRAARVRELTRAADEALAAAQGGLPAAPGAPPEVRVLAGVLVASRFWIGAARRDAISVDVLRTLLVCGTGPLDRETAEPALRGLTAALGDAASLGVLAPGSAQARAATVVLVGALAVPTMDLGGDPKHAPDLGVRLLEALLVGWEADQELLAAASRLVR